ncbi:MAG: AraC family transcriptional regulator [Pseudomonadota bacterium]
MTDIPSHVSTFSTDALPEKDRYAAFVEEHARKLYRIDVRRHGASPFYSRMRMAQLGPNRCMEVEYSAASYGRTPGLTLDGNDDFMIPVSVELPFTSSRLDLNVGVGQGILIDLSTSGCLTNTTGGKAQMFWMPRQTMMQLVPGAEDKAREGIVCDSIEMKLLSAYINAVLTVPDPSPTMLQMAGNHMLDLVVLALGATGDTAQDAGARGLKAARGLSLRQSVIQRLHDSGLTLTDIARSNGLSERHVQRLFEDIGTSFSGYLLDRRLEFAHHLLLNPLHRNRRITDIALDAGFGDLSHFNRSFRKRYGETPSDVRARLRGE